MGLGTAAAARPALAQISLDLGGLRRMAQAATINEHDEVEMGRKLFGPFVDAMGGAYQNRKVQDAVAQIAQPVLATSARKAFSWEVAVVDSNEVNAWTLPGGKVGVCKGLLRYVACEDELAAVLAHEMAHAELSHAASAMRGQAFRGLAAGAAAGAATSAADSDQQVGVGAGLASVELALLSLVSSGYSREAEREADRHIPVVFARTGHDLRRGAEFYRTLLQLTDPQNKGRTSLFAGHPQTQARLAELLALAPAEPGPPHDTAAFEAVKAYFPTRKVYQRQAR
ncbi:MAG: M48 family metalloprotease [Phenylobacterium sp.]